MVRRMGTLHYSSRSKDSMFHRPLGVFLLLVHNIC